MRGHQDFSLIVCKLCALVESARILAQPLTVAPARKGADYQTLPIIFLYESIITALQILPKYFQE